MYGDMRAELAARLAEIEAAGLTKHERALVTPQAARVRTVHGGEVREALNFCANNYLGLADDPQVEAATATWTTCRSGWRRPTPRERGAWSS